jgi:phosphate transport system protein
MGAKVEDIIAGSIRALIDRDSALAEQMIALDRKINQLEIDIDEHCMQVLARRQPVASDLRFLTTALKLVTDLERIGDLGVNICERVLELNGEPPLKPYVDMPNMAREAQEMLHEGLDAFVAADVERAQHVIARDRNVDAYYQQIFRELLTYMMEDPRNIFRATRLQSIAKYLGADRRPRHQPGRAGRLHGQRQGHPPRRQARRIARGCYPRGVPLTPEQRKSLVDDGYVIIPGVVRARR